MTVQPKNRWLRFSLRTMLVVVTVVCVLLASKVRQAEKQRKVVAWVLESGGGVVYDFERNFADQDGHPIGHYLQNGDWVSHAEPPGPTWLREMVGMDYLAAIVEVRWYNKAVTDVTPLENLPDLETLRIPTSSLQQAYPSVMKLTGLKELHLWMDIWDKRTSSLVTALDEAMPNCKVEAYGGM